MKKKCFGHSGRNGCRVLEVSQCQGSACSFYKTRKEFEVDIQKANQRLAVLDMAEQSYIAGKYYDGRMPWLEGGDGHEH